MKIALRAKASKAAALYVDHPVEAQRCGGCSMFVAPDACTIVEGEISSRAHCRFWAAARMKSFRRIMKDSPAVGDVHVSAALGGSKRRAKPFKAFIGSKPIVVATAKADSLSAPALVGLKNRSLDPYDAGTYHTPIRYDSNALGSLREDQVPRFLDAITHPDRLPTRVVRLDELTSIKNRVDGPVVRDHLARLGKTEPPIVLKMNGSLYIADGHDRVAAHWLNGDDEIEARYEDIEPVITYKPDPNTDHKGSKFDLLQPKNGRRLTWRPDGQLAVPFRYTPTFLPALRPDQVPPFLYAITHPDEGEKTKIPFEELSSIQRTINPDTVARFVESPSKNRPVIVKLNGGFHIADGHDRLAARWLRGKKSAKVCLFDLDTVSNRMKAAARWSTAFEITKADADKRQLFGWASVATMNGRPVIDKQGDIIPVDELEKAAYDFVLESRKQGDMHARTSGVGRLIESMVFSREKQKALGIDLGMEGWFVGFQCDCPELWRDVKTGKKLEFSIGGAAVPVEVEI